MLLKVLHHLPFASSLCNSPSLRGHLQGWYQAQDRESRAGERITSLRPTPEVLKHTILPGRGQNPLDERAGGAFAHQLCSLYDSASPRVHRGISTRLGRALASQRHQPSCSRELHTDAESSGSQATRDSDKPSPALDPRPFPTEALQLNRIGTSGPGGLGHVVNASSISKCLPIDVT